MLIFLVIRTRLALPVMSARPQRWPFPVPRTREFGRFNADKFGAHAPLTPPPAVHRFRANHKTRELALYGRVRTQQMAMQSMRREARDPPLLRLVSRSFPQDFGWSQIAEMHNRIAGPLKAELAVITVTLLIGGTKWQTIGRARAHSGIRAPTLLID
jgi:hypothetical protein